MTKRNPKTVICPKLRSARPAFFPRRWFYRLVLPVLLLSALCLRPVAAGGVPPGRNQHEKPYALIFGTVWGPDDQPVFGVNVKIRRQSEKKARWELVSDHRGEFAQRVPAGKADYVIWADLKGFKAGTATKLRAGEDVTVHIENDERVDTGLHLK